MPLGGVTHTAWGVSLEKPWVKAGPGGGFPEPHAARSCKRDLFPLSSPPPTRSLHAHLQDFSNSLGGKMAFGEIPGGFFPPWSLPPSWGFATFPGWCPGLWLPGGDGWIWVCHLCHLPAHRNSSFCWQVQPFLVHLLNLSRLRYIPIQKSLPFFLLPCFHRQLNVKFLLLSFYCFFPLLCDDGGCRSWGWPGLLSLSQCPPSHGAPADPRVQQMLSEK